MMKMISTDRLGRRFGNHGEPHSPADMFRVYDEIIAMDHTCLLSDFVETQSYDIRRPKE